MKPKRWWLGAVALIASTSACVDPGGQPLEYAFGDGGTEQLDDEVAVVRAAVISPSFNPPISLTTTGSVAPIATDLANTAAGNFMVGTHLNKPPVNANAGAASDTWVASVSGDRSVTSSATPTKLNEALADARSFTDSRATDWGRIGDTLRALSSYAGVVVTPPTTPAKRSFGYTPERARWLDRERTSAAASTSYPDPARFSELRERGARLYCAAKTAHAQAGGGNATHIMGRKSLASFKLLGEQIDLIGVEPTVAMSPPQKNLSIGNDGTQAFSIPMAVGARFAPASFLPTLPEMRTPVTLVTSDSETLARDNNGRFPSRDWQTATHADAFVTATQGLSINPDPITLFYIGPVAVSLDMELGVDAQACSQAGSLSDCTSNRFRTPNRLLMPLNAQWPAERSGGDTAGNFLAGTYNDDSWELRTLAGEFWPGQVEAYRLTAHPNTSAQGVRAFQDNDKSVEIRTSINADMRLHAGFSQRVGPVLFGVGVSGGLDGTATVVHAIREQEHIRRYAPVDVAVSYPETSLSVTPRTEASLDFVATANAIIDLTIRIFGQNITIPLGGKLFDVDEKIADIAGSNWPESNRLRMGTWTTVQRDVGTLSSHWPQKASFAAQPASLSSCLIEDERTGTLSTPCGAVDQNFTASNVDVETTQPRMQVCMVTTPGNPDDVASSNPEAQCRLDFKAFVNRGTHFTGFNYHSRVVDPNDPTWAAELKTATETCAARLGNTTNLQRFIRTELCRGNGALAASGEEVLEVDTLTQDGPGTRSDSGNPPFAALPQNSCQRP